MPNPLINSRVRETGGGDDIGAQDIATLECVIERVTFHNAENGYSVVKVSPLEAKSRAKGDVITVLGAFTNPIVGESLRCHGQWVKHPQYGSQFKLLRYETLRPATAVAIEKYLGSGMVKGIGPVMAKRIVDKFGKDALDVIETAPEKLTGVSGIGEKRIGMITAAWEEQKEVRAIMLFLQGHGVSPTYAVKIYRTYKERSIEVVEQNPYQLATDIWGIGFKSADKIAQNIGIAPDSAERLQAGLIYVLNQEMDNGGHCFLSEDALIEAACKILSTEEMPIERAPIERALADLVEQERLVAETVELMGTTDTAIYTPSIHTTEKAVAERVNTLLNSPWRMRLKPQEIDAVITGVPGHEQLSDEQNQAVRRALSEPLMILTGGPGCGKTYCTRTIVTAFEKLGKRLQLASPTGRAAKRLAEVTGREAKTIHRLLEFDPEKRGFKHGPGDPLDLDVLIIDEASMLDLVLTHNTLRAVPDGAQVLFVGDVDQLPSVGPGNVLSDLIDSGRVPVARLTQVFRQAAESRIITNAHAINRGRQPDLPPPQAIQDGADCVFLEVEEAEEMPQKIAGVVAKSLPRLGFARDEITVLAPMQRGSVGARNLNEVLQSVLNPPRADRAEVKRGPLVFRVGDRVMQRVNNYDKNVFNGDVGYILGIDLENQIVAIQYPEGPIEYDFADVDQLVHAFSLTIHKSQGSEYPACVIALHTQHYMMLARNLVYTALTRAKKLAVFVGSKRAIAMAVRNKKAVQRNTRLAQRLQRLVDDAGTVGRTRGMANRKDDTPPPALPGRLL
jgi:exodeoxyribonuclease V alpha subunit